MKLRTKFSIGITSIVTFAVVSVSAITILSDRQRLERELDQNYARLARQLARVSEEALYESRLTFFNYAKTLKNDPAIIGACFIDTQNTIRFHSTIELADTPFQLPTGAAVKNRGEGLTLSIYRDASGRRTLDYAATVQFANRDVGAAHLFVSMDAVKATLDALFYSDLNRIGLISILVLLLALAAVFLLANALVKPIQQVVQAMRQVSEGRLEAFRFPARRDELGLMGVELNATVAKLKELDEMKRDFVAGVTHDLRSPLNAIDGIATMLAQDVEKMSPEQRREFLMMIRNNAARLRDLIDDVLTTARLESGREEFDRAQFDLAGAARRVAEFYRPLAAEKNISLHLRLPPAPLQAWGDPDKVDSILMNLLSNAFKFTREGSVTLSLEKKTGAVKVAVADSGVGIPPSDRKRIFEKFYRSPANAKEAHGTGLGLYIVKRLVEGQGGTVGIEANAGGGTVVYFTLPV